MTKDTSNHVKPNTQRNLQTPRLMSNDASKRKVGTISQTLISCRLRLCFFVSIYAQLLENNLSTDSSSSSECFIGKYWEINCLQCFAMQLVSWLVVLKNFLWECLAV